MTASLAFLAFTLAPGADPAPGYVAGRVVDLQGKPLANAQVGLHVFGGSGPKPAFTGADGAFKLGPLLPGANFTAIVYADLAGFGREFAPAPPVLPGATTAFGDLVMAPGRLYKGRVLTDAGQAIPNADVRCEPSFRTNRYTTSNFGPPIDLTAGLKGEYVLPALPPGEVRVRYQALQRQKSSGSFTAELSGEDEELINYLKPGVTFRGRVLDEDGKPVAGAVIDPFDAKVVSGADGRFLLAGFGETWQPKRLMVQKSGFLRGEFNGGEGEVEVKLLRPGWFAGKAVDADTGAAVRLDRALISRKPPPNAPADLFPPFVATTLDQPEPGTFRVSFPAAGEHTFTLSAAGYADTKFTASAAERKVVEVPDVKLKKLPAAPAGAAPPGRATVGGKPLARGWAVLYRIPEPKFAADLARNRPVTPQRYAYAEVEVIDGTFALPVAQDKVADWYVAVYAPGRAPGIVGPLTLPGGKPAAVEVALPDSGSLSGVVTGAPAEYDGHLWVVAFAKNGFRAEVRVRPGGKFSFPALPPGEYGLKASHNAFKDADVVAEEPKPKMPIPPLADPWKRATKVTVKAGENTAMKELTLPDK